MPPADFPWPVVAAALGVVGSLTGVFLGSWLTTRRDRKAKDERNKSIRQMLKTEMQLNLDHHVAWRTGLPRPVQSNQIWESQLEAVPSALTGEQIKRVHGFYYELAGVRKFFDEKSRELEKTIRSFVAKGNRWSSASPTANGRSWAGLPLCLHWDDGLNPK